MAVYKRSYKGYTGVLTPPWSRFLIVPRSSFARLFQSKFLVVYLVACFFYPLGCVAFIYLSHNLTFLQTFNIPVGQALSVNARFFQFFCGFQGALAYLLTAFVGPGLIAPDLANNALPLYFCRPFSRIEYVLGKMSVLMSSSVAGHLDSRLDSFPDPVQPGGIGVDAVQPVDRGRDLWRLVGLGYCTLV